MNRAERTILIGQLEEALYKPDPDAAIALIERLGKSGDARVVPMLLQALARSNDLGVKHAAALELRDLRIDAAVPILFRIIRSPKYRRSRGTFVYALGPLNWQRHFLLGLATLICDDNFEVREMAVKALEQGASRLSRIQKLGLTTYLSRRLYAQRLSEEVSEGVGYTISLLADHETSSRREERQTA